MTKSSARTPRIIDPENLVRREVMKYFEAFKEDKIDLIDAVKGIMGLIRCPREYELRFNKKSILK